MTVVDGDAAGREDRRAVGELGFVAGGRGSFVPLQRQILRPGFGDLRDQLRRPAVPCFRGSTRISRFRSCRGAPIRLLESEPRVSPEGRSALAPIQ